MPKSEYRVVVLADDYRPEQIVEALLAAGIRPAHVHVSHDQYVPALAAQGVRFDVPCGQIRVESTVPCEKFYATSRDHLVP